MVRLIDADAIEHCLVIGGRRHGKTIISEIIRRAIQTAPTVDAVPVIRCKDCKWAIKCYGDVVMVDEYGEEIHEPLGMNGYCSMAERKE